jgi:uncharacterized membrane protein YgaE (UPF0421/DUF939 family)
MVMLGVLVGVGIAILVVVVMRRKRGQEKWRMTETFHPLETWT